ncbi:primase-associated protein [Natrinema salsiterrestre]|uniref:primase-associated protein n=1 Tax=Natrinema salsiterrestre TaxID=2950540 RepID=UPI0024052BAB|nr:primase-associated protein [Natrinema salsiterrestre]
MFHRKLSVFVAAVLVTSIVTGIVAADPPRPGTEGNGLTENESASLWSHDADTYISQEEYRQRYGENRSAAHQVANGTDITFKRPPATATTWTRNDFEDLDAGGADTSVHPPLADLEDVFSRWPWYDEQETEYQVRYEFSNTIDGDTPLPMNCDNDDLQRYCIGQDQCPYSIWGSLPFPDEMYEQVEEESAGLTEQF